MSLLNRNSISMLRCDPAEVRDLEVVGIPDDVVRAVLVVDGHDCWPVIRCTYSDGLVATYPCTRREDGKVEPLLDCTLTCERTLVSKVVEEIRDPEGTLISREVRDA